MEIVAKLNIFSLVANCSMFILIKLFTVVEPLPTYTFERYIISLIYLIIFFNSGFYDYHLGRPTTIFNCKV